MRIPWNKTMYEDEWIVDNLYAYPSYMELAKAHNEIFGTCIGATAIGQHVKHDLGIDKRRLSGEFLTNEQKAFIEDYYPNHPVSETVRAFNEKFGTNKKKCTMLNYARKHGLVVDKDIVTNLKRRPHGKDGSSKRAEKEVGSIKFDGRYWLIKTEYGWKPCHRAVWEKHNGNVKDGHAIIFLDGDRNNYAIENLAEIPIKYLGMLEKNDLRSSHPVLTKAGIAWCDLKVAIEKSTPTKEKPMIIQKNAQGETVNAFVSVADAMRQTGINHIRDVCVGDRMTAGGYVWERV